LIVTVGQALSPISIRSSGRGQSKRARDTLQRKSRPGAHRTAHFRNCRLEGRFRRFEFGEADGDAIHSL
jgi:hypothetical protein